MLKSDIPYQQPQINQNLRKDADETLQMILRCAIGLAKAQPEELVKNCISCENFKQDNEVCSKYNQKPPARVIAFGCTEYTNLTEDVPF